ncbi:hypothetical protein GF386_04055 [Candidatus Pacearchaeota archaeon]|nr:hypothetical protein [Candidatus Pacearchaeota archaeon]
MKLKPLMKKKGQIGLGDAPQVVMIVGFVFLIMATIAYVSEKYGDALTAGGTAANITDDLESELDDNTSIAGIVLTISLVGIVLSVLIGIFIASRRGGM